jgi:hypothetical protein
MAKHTSITVIVTSLKAQILSNSIFLSFSDQEETIIHNVWIQNHQLI